MFAESGFAFLFVLLVDWVASAVFHDRKGETIWVVLFQLFVIYILNYLCSKYIIT